MKYTRRSYLRRYGTVPIEINHDGIHQRHCAQMSDCCIGGMQLIADHFIEPGSEVVVHSGEHLAHIYNGAIGKERMARVVWCRECKETRVPRFIVGIRFARPLDH
jgi:hypothetical protein